MTVALSLGPSTAPESIRWFISGTEYANSETITVGPGGIELGAGRYWLDVVMRKATMVNSEGAFFAVTIDPAFVTTWDTSLASGTTVTLALAGEVDATIDWGDRTISHVTTAGPHTHDYGVDGVHTVSVTGSVTAHNAFENGGAQQKRVKLVSVANWGQLGFTSLRDEFASANLVSVPGDTVGIETVTDMGEMFYGAYSFNQHLSGWFVAVTPNGNDGTLRTWSYGR